MSGGRLNDSLQRQEVNPELWTLRSELFEDLFEMDTDYKEASQTVEARQTVEALRQLIVDTLEDEDTVNLNDELLEKLQRFEIAKVLTAQENEELDDEDIQTSFILTRDEIEEPFTYEPVPFVEYTPNFRITLPYYEPSEAVKQANINNFTGADFCDYLKSSVLEPSNMHQIYKTLLEMEDLTCMSHYPALARRNVQIQKSNSTYFFEVASSKEHAPIKDVLTAYMDEVVIVPRESASLDSAPKSPIDILSEHPHESINDMILRRKVATVVVVDSDRVYIQFKNDCDLNVKKVYDVIFRPIRTPFRFQHRALEMLAAQPSLQHYLFPKCDRQRQQHATTSIKLNFFNTEISKNPEQLEAVRNVVEVTNSYAPYIVFGPPGTGKTTTIVEAILQLRLTKPRSRILVTAGSNSACDTIALRICKYLKRNTAAAQSLYHCNRGAPGYLPIIRIFSQSILLKNLSDLDPDLLDISNASHGRYQYPDVKVLRRFGIIVATLCTVGKLINDGINEHQPHFTHIFIDEAGASTEMEALVGIVGIKKANDNCRVILSGDHKQLGPVLKSTRAEALGLGRSLMERLINRACYRSDANGNYDRSLQTRLRRNYRSHAEIVRLYNHLYYDNQLLANARQADVDRYHGLPLLANPDFPIIFQAVHGKTQRDPRSQSLYNNLEIEVLMWTMRRLLHDGIPGKNCIKPTDIGIISPYKCQYQRIQEELHKLGWFDVETGSTETFQGREKPIIIVSFVRSFSGLGFVSNPRRLNVILSRAKSLLILIGNPFTLQLNKDFKFIINECKRHGTLRRKKRLRNQEDALGSCSLVSSASASMLSLIEQNAIGNVQNPLATVVEENVAEHSMQVINPIQSHKGEDSNETMAKQFYRISSAGLPARLPTEEVVKTIQPIELQQTEEVCNNLLASSSESSSSLISLNSIYEESASEIEETIKAKELQQAEEISKRLLIISSKTTQNSTPHISNLSRSSSLKSLNSSFGENAAEIAEIYTPIDLQAQTSPNGLLGTPFIGSVQYESSPNSPAYLSCSSSSSLDLLNSILGENADGIHEISTLIPLRAQNIPNELLETSFVGNMHYKQHSSPNSSPNASPHFSRSSSQKPLNLSFELSAAEIAEMNTVIDLRAQNIPDELLGTPFIGSVQYESSPNSPACLSCSSSSSLDLLNSILGENADGIHEISTLIPLRAQNIPNELLETSFIGNMHCESPPNPSQIELQAQTSPNGLLGTPFIGSVQYESSPNSPACLSCSSSSSLDLLNSILGENADGIHEISTLIPLRAQNIPNELLETSFIGNMHCESSPNITNELLGTGNMRYESSPNSPECLSCSSSSSLDLLNSILGENAAEIHEISTLIPLRAQNIPNELLETFCIGNIHCESPPNPSQIELQAQNIPNELSGTPFSGNMKYESLPNSSPCLLRSSSQKLFNFSFEVNAAEIAKIITPIEIQQSEKMCNELLETLFIGNMHCELLNLCFGVNAAETEKIFEPIEIQSEKLFNEFLTTPFTKNIYSST